MKEKLRNLLTVKSVVTLILTVTFSLLSADGRISGEQFMTVFATVIAFYFGTQHEKQENKKKEES
ncbi:MAG: hypothetical protein IJ644_00615 [Oscillospiraceae bacterium]|nr:hypothetical protein [Oscillospiraceae bacterium]